MRITVEKYSCDGDKTGICKETIINRSKRAVLQPTWRMPEKVGSDSARKSRKAMINVRNTVLLIVNPDPVIIATSRLFLCNVTWR